jgi:GTP-binding protein
MEPHFSTRRAAIVGRPNVGKSALFNRLAGRKIAIVHDRPGVTRDRISAVCQLGKEPFEIVDTGGIGTSVDATFSEQVHTEAQIAIESSTLIILVVDAREGVTPVDASLAGRLRRAAAPVILAVNKVDTQRIEAAESDFLGLGIEPMLSVSAEHGRGIDDLVRAVEARLPPPDPEAEAHDGATPIGIAIVGRPNVGKSSIVNAILQDRRTIVNEVAGTTCDAVDVPYLRKGKRYTLIDTAGIRPRGKVNDSVEVFSVMRAERSIRRADICALIIDAPMGVTTQDKKIASLIQDARKPCLIVANKWDLMPAGEDRAEYIEEIRRSLFFLDYAPCVLMSAEQGRHLPRFFQAVDKIRSDAGSEFGTGPLNRLLQRIQTENPPPVRHGHRLKIFYATQIKDPEQQRVPTPSFICFVNDPRAVTEPYRKYLEGRMRQESRYAGLPIRFIFRGRSEN